MVRDGTQESVQDLLTAHAKMLGSTTGDVAIAVRQADALNTSITRSEAPAEAAAPAGASSDPGRDMLRRLRQGLDEVQREAPACRCPSWRRWCWKPRCAR